jgi:hypothetical protein
MAVFGKQLEMGKQMLLHLLRGVTATAFFAIGCSTKKLRGLVRGKNGPGEAALQA